MLCAAPQSCGAVRRLDPPKNTAELQADEQARAFREAQALQQAQNRAIEANSRAEQQLQEVKLRAQQQASQREKAKSRQEAEERAWFEAQEQGRLRVEEEAERLAHAMSRRRMPPDAKAPPKRLPSFSPMKASSNALQVDDDGSGKVPRVLREVRIHKPRPDVKLGVRLAARRDGVAGEGIELIDVHPESPIAQAGVEVGDVLLSVNGATCDALKDGARLLREAEGAVALLILKLN